MKINIHRAIKEALALESLVPNTHVNKVMTQLVESVIENGDMDMHALMQDGTVSQIRSVSAEAESEMEKFWARLVVGSLHPKETLDSFPYIDNYAELIKRELGLVKKSGLLLNHTHKVLIIGSGPLPLSAYELCRQTGAKVDHVDSSQEAILLCKEMSRVLSIQSNYYESCGESVVLSDIYDLVLIAALAGSTVSSKQAIISNILPHLSANGRIIVRSAHGSRALLYPAINSTDLSGVRLLEEYHPTDHVINSVLVYGRLL